MILYHGSKIEGLKEIKALNDLPVSEQKVVGTTTTDADRKFFRDVVFLTTSKELASQYASKDGVIYVVEAYNVRLYCEEFKKRVKEGLVTRSKKKNLQKKLEKLEKNQTVYVAKKAVVIAEERVL